MCKTNYSSNDNDPRLFNVNSLDIIRSSLTTKIIYFKQVHYETFFSLKYLFHYFLPVVHNNFYKNNLLKRGFQNYLFAKYTENVTSGNSFCNFTGRKIPT